MTPEDAAVLEALIRLGSERRASRWIPHRPTERQAAFLDLDTMEGLYGGAAGGGKTDALLMAALQYADVPGYSALLLRRTFPELEGADGLISRAHDWLGPTAAEWREAKSRWEFPSGATLQFGHMQHETDKYKYQGQAYHFVGYDELTHFTETQYTYLLSRMRRLRTQSVPVRMRAATNPGGIGHKWVKGRFVDPGDPARPFVPAKLADNPHLDQDEYRRALAQLDSTTRAQLEDGLWVMDGQGLVYRFSRALNVVEALPPGQWEYVLAIDLGSSESKPTTGFVVLAFRWDAPGVYVVHAQKLAGLSPTTIADEARRLEESLTDGGFIETVADAGALGKGYLREWAERDLLSANAAQKANKLGFRKLLNGALERGELHLVEGQCEELIDELETLPWNERGTDAAPGFDDHLTDALLYGWRATKAHLHEPSAKRLDPRSSEYVEEELVKRERERWQEQRSRPWWMQR